MPAGLGEPSSQICRSTTLVKVQPFTGAGAVPCTQTRRKFPVLVRVTAAAAAAEEISVVGVDIVAVLDVGGGGGDKLQRITNAMKVVIRRLGPDDRLSIVSFDTDVRRLTELTRMCDQGPSAARNVVMGLSTNGAANTGPRAAPAALDEGAKILRERHHDEKSGRVGCIVFLSDSVDTQILGASISSDFPVHALALGADHDPKAMKHIAVETSGTYSFANNDMGKVKDACALFTSVPATSMEITLRAHEGAFISDEKNSDGGRSAVIRIDNMYAGEKKNFIVYLALQATEKGEQKLLTIGGRYQNVSESKNLADTDVSVMRPEGKYSGDNVPDVPVIWPDGNVPRWAEVVAQIKLFFMGISICGLVPQPSTATTQAITSKLQQICQNFCKSTEGKLKCARQTMENFNQNMMRGINKVPGLPLPYKFSWPRSRNWQRATTTNEPRSPETAGDFQTLQQETEGIVQVQDGNHGNTTATTWGKIRDWGRNLHPCSRLLPSRGVAVVLFMAWLLLMLLYSGLQGTSMTKKSIVLLQYPMFLFPSNYYAALDANEAKVPKLQDPVWKNGQQGQEVTDESSSPGQGRRDHADDATKVISPVVISDNKCGEGHGCDRDTYRESDLVAKILDIIITGVQEKEMELKSLLVEAQNDHGISALVAKILNIIITDVQEKEIELKCLLVEAQYDHE